MLLARHSVVVDRPIDEVYAYLADGRNNPTWRDGVIEIERVTDTDGDGPEYRQVMRGPMGRPIRGDYRITNAEPPTALSFEVVAGPARPAGRFELSSRETGTEVTFELTMEPRGPSRLFAGMVRKEMEREVRSLDNLREQLAT